MFKTVIFSENRGWHEDQLIDAMASYHTEAEVVSLRDCRIGSGTDIPGLSIPGFRDQLPVAAIVRAIPAGSFEEVTFRLDILHALEASGIPVYNPARTIECTVDKAMTSFLLSRSGIPTPETWVCENGDEVFELVNKKTASGEYLVLKPLFGNCGRGLVLIKTPADLPQRDELAGIYYLQTFITGSGQSFRDWRVFVIADKAVAAMERVSNNWITNRARGADCLPAVLTDELASLAEKAAMATGTSYAGVDIIMNKSGEFLVLEVNSVPAWRGLQSVCSVNISELLVSNLLKLIKNPSLLSINHQ